MWKNGLKHGFGKYDLKSVGQIYEGFWMKVGNHIFSANLQDKKHGSGWLVYPDRSQYRGEFINDEPVSKGVHESVERRHSAESRLSADRESIESSKSDYSRRSATSPKLFEYERTIRHERSRSFVDTVGRRIKNPI